MLALESDGKAQLMVMLSKNVVENKGWHAGHIIKEIASNINGGGGGQAFFATAGGSKPSGIQDALDVFKKIILG